MSIQALLSGAGKLGQLAGAFGGVFGGSSEPNVAKALSQRYGCRILQSSAPAARQLIAAGINPCTKQPIPGGAQTVTVPPGFGPAMPRANMSRREAGELIVRGGQAVGRAIMGSTGVVNRTATGRISSVMLGNRRVSRRDIASLLRRIGDIATGAAIVGISLQDAADIVISSSKRRRRGITAAQVRNARRTACMVSRLARDLGVKPAPVRRRTCR